MNGSKNACGPRPAKADNPDFRDHPAVIDGASELFAAVFGPDAGVGARSAVGMGSLPANIAVEIEMVVEVTG